MESDAAAQLPAALERSDATLPLDTNSPISPVQKRRRLLSAPGSAAGFSLVRQLKPLRLFSAAESDRLELHDVTSAAASRSASQPPDIGPLSGWYSEQQHGFYGTYAEIAAKQQLATVPLQRKAIETGTACWDDARDSVVLELDSSKRFGGMPHSEAVREAAEGDPRQPVDFYHFLSMLQGCNPAVVAEFVQVLVDEWKAVGRIFSRSNWSNQTFFAALGRPLTEEEFEGASQVPWAHADVPANCFLLREARCMCVGKAGGGGAYQTHGKDKGAGQHVTEAINMSCHLPEGCASTEDWDRYREDNPAWREQLKLRDPKLGTMSFKVFQVLEKHNLPDFVAGLQYSLRRDGVIGLKFQNGKPLPLTCRLQFKTHVIVAMLAPVSRVFPLARKLEKTKKGVPSAKYPNWSHFCRSVAGAGCTTYGGFHWSGKLLLPQKMLHVDSPIIQHIARHESSAAESASDECRGEIATACGKLMVRTSEWTWEHLRGLAPSEQHRRALDQLVEEGPGASPAGN